MDNLKYLILDTETGGIGRDKSLLTAYFGIYDRNFNKLSELDLSLKNKYGIYVVTAEALMINKIDLKIHDEYAITFQEGGTQLYNLLKENTNDGESKLIPVGHNVHFDIEKIKEFLISDGSWNKFVSYRKIDTGVLAQALKVIEKLPDKLSGSLGSLAEFFNIEHKKAHTAKGDSEVTIEVLKNLLNMIK